MDGYLDPARELGQFHLAGPTLLLDSDQTRDLTVPLARLTVQVQASDGTPLQGADVHLPRMDIDGFQLYPGAGPTSGDAAAFDLVPTDPAGQTSSLTLPGRYDGTGRISVPALRFSAELSIPPISGDRTVVVRIERSPQADTTPPQVTGIPDRPANSHGWYHDDVTITWTATDPPPSSGTPTQPPPPTTAATQGRNHSYISAPSCDPAGNCATGTLVLSLDKTPPTIALNGPTAHATYTLGHAPAASCRTSDALSGVATRASRLTTRDTAGGYTQTCAGATDLAGNTAGPVRVTYTVRPTIASLIELTDQYVTASRAPNANRVKASLDAKLAAGHIHRYIREVHRRTTGRHPALTQQQASELTYWALLLEPDCDLR